MATHRSSPFYGVAVLFAVAGASALQADTAITAPATASGTAFDTLRYDWLKPVEDQRVADATGTFSTTSGIDMTDPFAVVSSSSLWQDKQGANYSRSVMDNLSLTCAASNITQDGSPDALGSNVTAGTTFKPVDGLNFQGNVHSSDNDQSVTPAQTTGTGASVETHLPLGSVVNVGVNTDETRCDANPGLDVATNAYDAQLQKPVGKLPLTMVFKGHYTETDTPGIGTTRMPSLEQSLAWKAGADTTLQAGLRQEQYQNVPGLTNELNQALFADWSQKILDDVTWHSYAEMLNTRSTIEFAEAGAGTNGTAQPNTPNGSTASVSSALPVSTSDEKLTFSTGPSFKLQKDVSASVEYSNSWDQNPAAGSVSQEQRVSVSLKGTF